MEAQEDQANSPAAEPARGRDRPLRRPSLALHLGTPHLQDPAPASQRVTDHLWEVR